MLQQEHTLEQPVLMQVLAHQLQLVLYITICMMLLFTMATYGRFIIHITQ